MKPVSKLQSSSWQSKRNKAELLHGNELLMQINFKGRHADVKLDDHYWQIRREGFWCSGISVVENGKMILSLKHIGFWRRNNEILIEGRKYFAKVRQRMRIAITYSNETEEILEYRLNAFSRSPRFIFKVNGISIPESDLFLLVALGFYTIRNVMNEYSASLTTSFVIASS